MMLENSFIQIISSSIRDNWDALCIKEMHGETISYGELGDRILAFHNWARQLGIKPTDSIALVAPNSILWGSVYLSVLTYGAVIVPISIDLPLRDICNVLRHSDAKVAIVEETLKEKLSASFAEKLPQLFSLQQLNFDLENTVHKESFHLPPIAEDKVAEICYTSGTCGTPKGVMLSLIPIVSNLHFAQESFPLNKGSRIVSILPFSHSFGCVYELLYPISVGASIYILGQKPTPPIIMHTFNEIEPTMVFTVPLIIEKMYKNIMKPFNAKCWSQMSQSEKQHIRKCFLGYFSSKCEAIVIGGAKLNPDIEDKLTELNIPISCGYGMTECGPVISWNNPKHTKMHSVGTLVKGMQGKVVDLQNGVGEIVLKGVNLMLGYYKNPEASKLVVDSEGWLHTGDLGIIDDEGFVFLKGRMKNVILRNDGNNIYINDLERQIIDACPEIDECLVVEREGKLVVKIVSARSVPQTEKRELLLRINKAVPKYAQIAILEIESKPFMRNSKNEILRQYYQ